MNFRLTLTGKILLTAALNLALLVVSAALLVQSQMAAGIDSILLSPTYTRLQEMNEGLVDLLHTTPREKWDALLAETGARKSIELSLYLNTGELVAGSARPMPAEVMRQAANERPEILAGDRRKGPAGSVRSRPDPFQVLNDPPSPGQRRGKGKEKGKEKGKGKQGGFGPGPPPGSIMMFMVKTEGARPYWFGARVPVPLEPGAQARRGTMVISSASLFLNPALFDPGPWVWGLLLLALISMLCWMPLTGYLTRSLRSLQQGAERIAGGEFGGRLKAGGGDEIGQLSASLNRMAAQLDGFVSGQKRFLGGVAHELSAPIARTQAAVAILEQRSPESAQPYVARLDSEVQHMSSLVHELLHFSRAGLEGQPAEPPEAQRVGDIVARVIEREAPGGEAVRLTEGQDLQLMAPPNSVFRALSNVVRNALRYAGNAGPIRIAARPEREAGAPPRVAIVVADEGPGVPEELLDRVFTPFYRVENSRSRSSGGSGLGLAMVKSSIEAAGGSVTCRNRKPRGLEVTIVLPAG